MSAHPLESAYPSSYIRRGVFAYPLQAIQVKEKRCLEASRKEYLDASVNIRVGSHQISQYVSADGMLYFGHEQFLSPNNLTNSVVFSAFLVASTELSQYLAAQSSHFNRFEVVIVLQCVSSTDPRFSYYFVDHQLRRISDESILLEERIDNHGTIGWNMADHNYWTHVAIFSTHRPCTPEDYDQALGLLLELQSQALASPDMQNDDISNDLETMRNLLSLFNRNRIGTHATASIAKIMKRFVLPPAPKPRDPTPLGSTILRSLRGIVLLRDSGQNEEYDNAEDDTHPTMHEDSFESMTLFNETGSHTLKSRLQIRWRENEE
ncbi:unnamed protein product [Rhizoctonia solani]|uniref:Uncharacterized protein n=3 Tax=Rhizoctonia solani TaxID=456999 RepID=A0A8H3AS10_9AGAM|nr:hypothetical protein RSOL_222630 [Rhizoctonia solani AG-3 Rhs1AP]KEP50196.1 hypothetical protein V565_084780 [Rhizoctonia solani 123E]CAE6379330.1 unnamed protein product [Rhizoctonia solani]CAE6433632.1 unnamed protein product [Rhizoctonia solani]